MSEFSATDNKQPALPQREIRRKGADTTSARFGAGSKTSSCSCGGGCPKCQAASNNLKVSQANDPAEIQADQIADKTMAMRDVTPVSGTSDSANTLHRKSGNAEAAKNRSIQSTPLAPGNTPAAQISTHVQSALGSGGAPLEAGTRDFFESRMRHDLGNVRIHDNAGAHQSAQAVDAKAYTLGNDIFFGHNQYQPESQSGKQLLAHELAHVVQSEGASSTIQRKTIYRTPVEQPSIVGPEATPQQQLAAAKELLSKRGDSDYTITYLEKQNIGIELRQVSTGYYDAWLKKIILNSGSSYKEMAQTILFETRKLQVDSHKHDISVDLGIRAYENEKYRRGQGVGDSSLYEKYMPKTRDEYVGDKLSTVAEAASDTIEFNMGIRNMGLATIPAPLESIFTDAYYLEYVKQYGATYAESLSYNVADNRAREKGSTAGRAAIERAVRQGKLLSGAEHKTYGDVFDNEWKQIEAARAKKEAALAEERAKAKIEHDRQAKIEAMTTGLAEVVNKLEPDDANVEKVMKIVNGVFPLLGGASQFLFIKKADAGLDKILGPFGYKTVYGVEIGQLQVDRFYYGIGNFFALSAKERAALRVELRTNPFAAEKHGVQLWPTEAERRAEGRLVAIRKLPDGSLHTGTLDEFHDAEDQNRINHALQQLEAISNAGPGALIGRIIDGERGAAIGAMFDSGLMILAPIRARQNMRNQINAMGDGVAGVPDARLEPLAIRQRLKPVQPKISLPRADVTGGKAFDTSLPAVKTTVTPPAAKPAVRSPVATEPVVEPVATKPAPVMTKPVTTPVVATPAVTKPVTTPAVSAAPQLTVKPQATSELQKIGINVETPQVLDAANFSKIKLGSKQFALYILRDTDGEILKPGRTSEGGAISRLGRYKLAGAAQIEIYPIQGKATAKTANAMETLLRNKLESEGHKMPWDNTGGRLGRTGFGTPGEGVRTPPITRDKLIELLTLYKGNRKNVGAALKVHHRTVGMWALAYGIDTKTYK